MNAFTKRFFVCISLIFLGFTAFSFQNNILIFFLIFLSFLTVFYFFMSKTKKKYKNLKLVCILLLCASVLGIFCSGVQTLRCNRLVEEYSGEHRVSGYVKEVSVRENFISEYVVNIEELDGKSVNFDMVLVASYKCDLTRGDFFELTGRIYSTESYDDYEFLNNKNVYDYPIICSIDDSVEIVYCESEFRIPLALSGLNSRASSILKAVVGKNGGTLASALLLGNRDLLPADTLRDFKRAGVYHMLALSGLHVAILIGIFDWILKKMLSPRGIRILVLTVLSLFYVALTGFALSACRSMLMLWIFYLSLLIGKQRDTMTSLFLAVFVIVLINPSSILDVGLQLSFFSTFGVVASSIIANKIKWFKESESEDGIKKYLLRIVRKLALLMLSSVCVFIVTLPLIMVYFGEVSLATFFSNLFMGLLCEVFMVVSLITLLLSSNSFLRVPFASFSSYIADFITDTVSFISDKEGVMLSLEYPNIERLVWGLFVAFVLLLAIKYSRKWLIFLPGVVFAILLCISILIYGALRDDFVRAEYLSNDTVVLSSGDEVYICDISDGSYGALYEGIQLARENCFTEIDGIVLTHYHSDHIVTLSRLSKAFKIHGVFLPMPQNRDEDIIVRSIVRVLKSESVPVYIFENGRELDILSGKLYVSPRAYISGYAHPCVGISFEHGEERVTVLGKSYFDTYLAYSGLLDAYIEDSDYLIFGADGRNPQREFELFSALKNGCEVSFSDFGLMNKSDFEEYLDKHRIYFNVEYKKYDLK